MAVTREMARCDQKWMWWLAMGAHYTQLNTSDSVRWAHTNIKPNVLGSVAVSNGCHYISNTRQPENSSCTGNTGFLKCAILQRQIASISLYHLVVGSFSHFAHFTVYMNQYIHFSTWCCGRNTTNCYILVLSCSLNGFVLLGAFDLVFRWVLFSQYFSIEAIWFRVSEGTFCMVINNIESLIHWLSMQWKLCKQIILHDDYPNRIFCMHSCRKLTYNWRKLSMDQHRNHMII